jgi:hypothetical protein
LKVKLFGEKQDASRPHPLIVAYVKAALEFQKEKRIAKAS